MRRLAALALALTLGCITPGAPEGTPDANLTAPVAPTPGANATAPPEPMGERAPASTERFVLLANHTLGVARADTPEAPVEKVPETLPATAFYQANVEPPELGQWLSSPFRSAWESTGDIEVTLAFTSDAPAVGTTPKQIGFPPVGGWLGTPERAAFFLASPDAPDTLEAGKVYTTRIVAKQPQGGFFVREGEQLALSVYLAYQRADGAPASYVVGGPDAAGVRLPHQHFNLSATRPVVLVDESGELKPNPAPTGDMQQEPIDLAFSVPPDAVYVVLEVSGAPKAGAHVDLDVSARTASGEIVAGGSSPGSTEVAVVGPGNLKAYGRDLVAHVTSASSPAGATYQLTITAYVP